MTDLPALFGQIDIYLFDQLLRGRVRPGMRLLDAGCGSGRNLVYLLQAGYEVCACDADAQAVARVRDMAASLAPALSPGHFRHEAVEDNSFDAGSMDVVISSAVLHFARDPAHFEAMLLGSWRPLRAGGLFFCRLASSIGLESRVRPIGDGRFLLPDGSQRFLVDEARLVHYTDALGGDLVDPIKSTIVQDQRTMTTWVVRRR